MRRIIDRGIKEIGEVSQTAYSIGSNSPVGVFNKEGISHLIYTSFAANNHTVANNVGYLQTLVISLEVVGVLLVAITSTYTKRRSLGLIVAYPPLPRSRLWKTVAEKEN